MTLSDPHVRTQRFLELYNEIENLLAKRCAGLGRGSGLGDYVRMVKDRDRQVRRYEQELDAIRVLRNAIAHARYQGGRPIASPYPETVTSTQRLLEALSNPPLVGKFMHSPSTAGLSDPLRGHLESMTRQSFSQLPVTHDGEVVGLLTTNSIARWVGAHLEDKIMDLEVAVSAVLEHAEAHELPLFISRTTTALEACELLARADGPQALIVTQSGKKSESALGIVTAADVPAMLSATNLG